MVYVYMFLAESKLYVPIKLMALTGNSRDFTVSRTLQKNQIHITRHLLWYTLTVNWSLLLLKLGNTEVSLPILVTAPLMDKYRVGSIMRNNELFSCIILLNGVIWLAPHKFNTKNMQDINQST